MKKNKYNPDFYKIPPLEEKQIYSIPEYRRLHKECEQCRCVICAYWYTDCRTCAVCVRGAHPFTHCRGFKLYIFSKDPYKEYIEELDKLKEERRFYIE